MGTKEAHARRHKELALEVELCWLRLLASGAAERVHSRYSGMSRGRFLQAGRPLTVLSRDPLWPVLPRGCDPHAPGLVIAIWVSVGRGFSRTLVA